MSNIVKTQKRKHTHQQQSIHRTGKHKHVVRETSFVSMSEARQIAEQVFAGIAWSG